MQDSSDEMIEVDLIDAILVDEVSYRVSTNIHRQVAGANKVAQSASIQHLHP